MDIVLGLSPIEQVLVHSAALSRTVKNPAEWPGIFVQSSAPHEILTDISLDHLWPRWAVQGRFEMVSLGFVYVNHRQS